MSIDLVHSSEEHKNHGQIQRWSKWGHLLLFLGLTYRAYKPWCQHCFGFVYFFYQDAHSFQCCVSVSIGSQRFISFPSASGVSTNACFSMVETKALQ